MNRKELENFCYKVYEKEVLNSHEMRLICAHAVSRLREKGYTVIVNHWDSINNRYEVK